MAAGPYIAVDWGTTNRRAYRISAAGEVEEELRDGQGILSVPPGGFAGEAAAIRARLGDLPMLCAGMVGSNRGWVETPYLPCPVGLADLAGALTWVEPERMAILPGISSDQRDVMRGEEVQFLGAVAAKMAPLNGPLCQPGTHTKWAEMVGGRLEGFTTAMTGELFALLKTHSLLAPQLAGEVSAGAPFLEGVRDSGIDLQARLFGVRAASLLGRRADEDAAAYASGLLIGTDVRAQYPAARDVHLLAEPPLDALYAAAIEALGGRVIALDSKAAFVAGMNAIWSRA